MNDPNNYRPKSIVPFLSKPIEICVSNRIMNFLKGKNLKPKSQFGFRKGKPTVDATRELLGHLVECFGKG